MVDLEKENADLREQVKRLSRTATDRSYMLNAYREMLGPVALQVVDRWEGMGVTRQHTSWGPEAHKLSGEERAQVLLAAFTSHAAPAASAGAA